MVPDLIDARYVGLKGHRTSTRGEDFIHRPRSALCTPCIIQNHSGALLAEFKGDGTSNPAARTRDQRNFSVECGNVIHVRQVM